MLQLSRPTWIALALTTTMGCANQMEKAPQSASAHPSTYSSGDVRLTYPSLFQIATDQRRAVIRFLPRSRSPYWEDEIIIRKLNRKTEQCDIPQNAQPDSCDQRIIAGHRAYAYSGEDAAMNRYIKTKGYMIERGGFCWDFQLVRTGKPYHKFNLPENERKRLDAQSDRDSTAAEAAFKLILDSFVFLRPK